MSAAAKPLTVPTEFQDCPDACLSISSPEFNLVVACCADPDSPRIHVREMLRYPLDWNRVLELAEHHRVLPQVYQLLANYSEMVPSLYLSKLRSRYHSNAHRALWFTKELVRILRHLAVRGIEALPLKGPALAELLYEDVTQRQFCDLDLLVHARDVARAKAALSDLGYWSAIDLTAREEQAYLDSGYEHSFRGASGNLLELQWQILPRFYSIEFDISGFFQRTEPSSLGGHPVRTLCSSDLMLMLSVHAAKHCWSQLSFVCDIARLMKCSPDWDGILAETRRLGIERIVVVNLLLAHQLLGVELPARAQAWVEKSIPADVLMGEILRSLNRLEPHEAESLGYFQMMLRLRERWRDRARLLGRLLFTPSLGEWSAVRLPAPLFPLYHLVRLFRLTKRFAFSE